MTTAASGPDAEKAATAELDNERPIRSDPARQRRDPRPTCSLGSLSPSAVRVRVAGELVTVPYTPARPPARVLPWAE